jgi:hypothetical protein
MYSRFGYNRQIWQGRRLYAFYKYTIYKTNSSVHKYINNKRCLPLVERVLLGGKIMVQDYMFTIYSYTLHQLYIKSCKPKLHIYNNRTKCQYNYRCSIKIHVDKIHIFVLINIQCTFKNTINILSVNSVSVGQLCGQSCQ